MKKFVLPMKKLPSEFDLELCEGTTSFNEIHKGTSFPRNFDLVQTFLALWRISESQSYIYMR